MTEILTVSHADLKKRIFRKRDLKILYILEIGIMCRSQLLTVYRIENNERIGYLHLLIVLFIYVGQKFHLRVFSNDNYTTTTSKARTDPGRSEGFDRPRRKKG